jgi:hypothetical protein
VQHLEDLPLLDFIKAVHNLPLMHASEKLDGANLWMGLDDEGRLFTNRNGKRKGSSNFYSEEEYPRFAAYNGFRSAMAALQAKEVDIKRVMQPGQTVEIEVLYGRQPNAVTYGADDKSYIAFLRGVEGTPDVIADQLSMTLGGQSVTVDVQIVDTTDGENLDIHDQQITYQFTGAQKIPADKLKDVNIKDLVTGLEKYLQEPAKLDGLELTNGDLLANSLGSIPADLRPAAKLKKTEVMAHVMTDFKLPIKKELLDKYVRAIVPALGAPDLTADEDVGIEGVVLRDPTTGNMIKLVDKEAFTTINSFNHAIRNQVSGVVKTLDGNAPLEARGGILGNMKIRIADLLGNKELARGATAKRAFAAVKGADPVQTVKNFASNLSINDFLGTKQKMLAIIQQAAIDLRALLADFQANKDEFRLKLKNGRVIGISPEIEKRTLLVFAESRRNILELFDKVKVAKTLAQVIAILYGSQAKAVNQDDSVPPEVSEGLDPLFENSANTDTQRYMRKSAYQLMNIYFATMFMAIIFFKSDYKRGIRAIHDSMNYRLTKYDKGMSQVNFWGYPIWHASSPAVKKLIGPKHAAEIFKITRRAAPSRSRYLHKDLSIGKQDSINWADHKKTMQILQRFRGMDVDRINMLMDGVFNYENLTLDEKIKVLSKLYYYVVLFIPASPLFVRLKSVQADLLLNANGENEEMVEQMKLLTKVNKLIEDEEGMGQPVGSALDTAVRATDANSTPATSIGMLRRNRTVIKRKRNPDVKRAKFPKPDDSTV